MEEIAPARPNFPALCWGVVQHLLCPFCFAASSYGSPGELLRSKKRRVCVCQGGGGQSALSRRSFAVCFAPPPFDVFFLSAIAASPPQERPLSKSVVFGESRLFLLLNHGMVQGLKTPFCIRVLLSASPDNGVATVSTPGQDTKPQLRPAAHDRAPSASEASDQLL